MRVRGFTLLGVLVGVDSLASGTADSDGVPDLITTDTNNQHVTVLLSTP